ncbi:MAG: hypothetical protein A3G41_07385 [Elusimicrobia bacterium RIFCSPLOWO2_12_FULL_59_9]|nr:MAG: hypothetical protein A3G41_07385 [Elusimicrobia bacterium RIFCSPLOWO2_12_FULL_59_9]
MAQTLEKAKKVSPRDYFLNLSPGKLAGLKQITDAGGRFKVFALDQSNSFKKALRAMHERQGAPAEPDYGEIRDVKMEMVSFLGGYASGVLLDVNYGARQCLNTGSLPRGVGLIVRCEMSRDAGLAGQMEPGWSVEKIKRMGAGAVKLLVYLDTTDAKNTRAQEAFVKQVWRECQKWDILLMIEELSYPRKGEDKDAPEYLVRKSRNILEACKLIGPYADILKLEFPGNLKSMGEAEIMDNLEALDEAAIRPWVLLSAGEKFDVFIQYVEMAMKAGSSGYMAGRAIFNEYFLQDTPAQRRQFLKTTGAQRIEKLNEIIDREATPWMDRYQLSAEAMGSAVRPDWYLEKGRRAAAREGVQGDY